MRLTSYPLLTGLTREIHDVMVMGREDEEFEPTLVILDYRKQGRSFSIPLQAGWKYMDPRAYLDQPKVDKLDADEWAKLKENLKLKLKFSPDKYELMKASQDGLIVALAETLSRRMQLMKCVTWNLLKCLQIFEINPSPQSVSQLLFFIQDGLDDLKNHMSPVNEDSVIAGEVTIFEAGRQIAQKPLEITESDLLRQN